MLHAHTPHDAAGFLDRLCFYAVRSGFKHLASCPSDHNEVLVALLLSLQDHVSTYSLQYATFEWDVWMTKVPWLALYIVTRFGHLSMLRYYLDCYPVQATEQDNPLVYAALYSDPPRVQLLLDKGLDVNVAGPIYTSLNVYKMSPLTAATRSQAPEFQESLVRLLLAQGCIVPTYVVHSALQRSMDMGVLCKPAVIRVLLDHGASPTLLVAGSKSSLHLLLEYSASLSDDEFAIACMLVTAGCDPLGMDDDGFSPFRHAINKGEIKWIQWLLQNGFQLPPDAILHAFPKSSSKYIDMLRMTRFLIANGASVQVRDAEGCNAFHHLAHLPLIDYESLATAVRLLLSQGCDINCQNESGETPLHLIAIYRPRLESVELFVAHGAQLPIDIINYSVTNNILLFHWGAGLYLTTVLIPLVRTYGASCRSVTQGGDNALHCILKKDSLNLHPHASYLVTKLLLENGCDIRATNLWGATPLQLALENGHLSSAQLILSQLSVSPIDLGITIPHAIDPKGNGILHRLCGKLWEFWEIGEDEFLDRLTMLQEVAYDLAKDINRPNHKGFTPLCIILGAYRHELSRASDETMRVISLLLDLGARFSDVTPLYRDSFEWASDLPWYHNAIEAYRLSQSRFKPCFGDVTEVFYLLQLAHLPKIPLPVARLIMNMAECWAYTKVVRYDIRNTIAHGGVPIAFPEISSDAGCWTPRRVTFSCKPRVVLDLSRG